MRKCPNCGGKASQCRCPAESIEIQRVMNHAVRRGRLEVVDAQEDTREEHDEIMFEDALKDDIGRRSL